MSREAFEAWFKPTFYDDCAWSESRNCYVEPSVHMAWKGWQAAIQHACDVAERCRSATTTYGETPISLAHDLGVSDCADAIKEALK